MGIYFNIIKELFLQKKGFLSRKKNIVNFIQREIREVFLIRLCSFIRYIFMLYEKYIENKLIWKSFFEARTRFQKITL